MRWWARQRFVDARAKRTPRFFCFCEPRLFCFGDVFDVFGDFDVFDRSEPFDRFAAPAVACASLSSCGCLRLLCARFVCGFCFDGAFNGALRFAGVRCCSSCFASTSAWAAALRCCCFEGCVCLTQSRETQEQCEEGYAK